MEPNVIVSSKVCFIKIIFNGSNIQTIFDINKVQYKLEYGILDNGIKLEYGIQMRVTEIFTT